MDTRQLKHFTTVAEELHFGKAAKRLHMSQPPLSQSIQKLEEELGTTLFVRTSRKVRLTNEGRYLLAEAHEILKRMDNAAGMVGRLARGETGRLRVGVVGPALEGQLPCTIRQFCRDNPDVSISMSQLYSSEQLEKLASGELDVGVARLFTPPPSDLDHAVLLREPYVLAIPDGHPLAALSAVPLERLDGESLAIFPRQAHPRLYDSILSALSEAGACPVVESVALVMHTINALVAAGMGVAFMPESMQALPRPGVSYRPVIGRLPVVEYSIVWPKHGDSPLTRRFVTALLDAEKKCTA